MISSHGSYSRSTSGRHNNLTNNRENPKKGVEINMVGGQINTVEGTIRKESRITRRERYRVNVQYLHFGSYYESFDTKCG